MIVPSSSWSNQICKVYVPWAHIFKCLAHEWLQGHLLFELRQLHFPFHNQYNRIFYGKRTFSSLGYTYMLYKRERNFTKIKGWGKTHFQAMGAMGRYTRNDEE